MAEPVFSLVVHEWHSLGGLSSGFFLDLPIMDSQTGARLEAALMEAVPNR